MKFLSKKSVRLKKQVNKQQQKNPNTITAIDLISRYDIYWYLLQNFYLKMELGLSACNYLNSCQTYSQAMGHQQAGMLCYCSKGH